jgi:prepilin-type N-terminal cleavage/methylation domain-containing protein
MTATPRSGVTLTEVIVVTAVLGIMLAVGLSFLPRHGSAVAQGQRVFAAAVQFGRFEAIKRNIAVDVTFAVGSSDVVVTDVDGNELRRFPLDPQASRVVVKAADPASMRFNARGVSVMPAARTVTIGIDGMDRYDRALEVSGQGAVRSAS